MVVGVTSKKMVKAKARISEKVSVHKLLLDFVTYPVIVRFVVGESFVY